MVGRGDRMELKDSLGQNQQYILHLPGEGKKKIGHLLKKRKEQIIAVDSDIAVITTATPDTAEDCSLIYQLGQSGISYINSAKDFSGEWKKTAKLPLILNALKGVTAPYSLVLDANDVVVLRDVDKEFIESWKRYSCDVLFNGSQYLYPKIFSSPMEKEQNSPFINHYLNAGVCFGYTEKLKELYEKAYYHSLHEHYAAYESEQYYIRISIIECTDIKCKIDDGSHLFLCSHGN